MLPHGYAQFPKAPVLQIPWQSRFLDQQQIIGHCRLYDRGHRASCADRNTHFQDPDPENFRILFFLDPYPVIIDGAFKGFEDDFQIDIGLVGNRCDTIHFFTSMIPTPRSSMNPSIIGVGRPTS